MDRIAFCIANNHHMIPSGFYWHFQRMMKPGGSPIVPGDTSVKASSINTEIETALKMGADWCFLMDVDQIFPPNTIPQLLQSAKENNAKIVSVLYNLGIPPYSPVAGWSLPKNGEVYPVNRNGKLWVDEYASLGKGVVEVDWVGSGGLLIHREVLEKLGTQPFMDIWDNEKPIRSVGHDINFCNRARQLGYKVYVDTDVHSGHGKFTYIDTIFAEAYNRCNMEAMKERVTHELTLELGYWNHVHQTENIVKDKHEDIRYQVHRMTYDIISGLVPKEGTAIDIGCGRGHLLDVLKSKTKLKLTGADFSPRAVDIIKNKGFDAKLFDVRHYSPNGDQNAYDVVIASHIIEHINDDNKFLELLARLAKPTGIVIIATPREAVLQQTVEHVRGYTEKEFETFLRSRFDSIEMHNTKRDFIAVLKEAK